MPERGPHRGAAPGAPQGRAAAAPPPPALLAPDPVPPAMPIRAAPPPGPGASPPGTGAAGASPPGAQGPGAGTSGAGVSAAGAAGGPGQDLSGPRLPPDASLHRFGFSPQQLRLVGETDMTDIPVTVSAEEARSGGRIRLAYTNAVSVMPDASRLRVWVNDTQLAEVAVDSPDPREPKTIDVALPPGLVEPGVNGVRLSVEARHRVDCTVGAAHELWVQIDPARSGLVFDGVREPRIDGPDDLPAARPSARGTMPIRLVVPAGTDAAGLGRMIEAVEAVALRGRFLHPEVSVSTGLTDAPGIDVLAATGPALAAGGFGEALRSRLDGALDGGPDGGAPDGGRGSAQGGAQAGPRVSVAGAADGETLVILSGADPSEVEGAIASLVPRADEAVPATPAGLRAVDRVRGHPMQGGSRATLRDLGLQTSEFSGRLFHASFEMLLPPDFYAADYGRVTLSLDAAYAGGLARGSQILVRVNDRDASSLPLGNTGGDTFRARPIVVPLSFFRPGLNHVAIDAELVDGATRACDIVAGRAARRFALLDTTEVQVPDLARIARLPALSALASAAFPYDREGRLDLVVPRPDGAAVSAAAAVVARMAVAADRLVDVALTVGRRPAPGGSALFVGAFADLPPEVLGAVGFDLDLMKERWSRVAGPEPAAPQRPREVAVGGVRPRSREAGLGREAGITHAAGFSRAAGMGAASPSDGLFRPASAAGWASHPLAALGGAINRMSGLTADDLPRWGVTEDRVAVTRDVEVAFAQHEAPGGGHATWTVVTAPSPATLRAGVADMAASRRWSSLEGRVTLFDPKSEIIDVVPARTEYFIETQDFSIANARLILAGLLSSYAFAYGGLFVVAAVLLGVVTLAVVRRHGAGA